MVEHRVWLTTRCVRRPDKHCVTVVFLVLLIFLLLCLCQRWFAGVSFIDYTPAKKCRRRFRGSCIKLLNVARLCQYIRRCEARTFQTFSAQSFPQLRTCRDFMCCVCVCVMYYNSADNSIIIISLHAESVRSLWYPFQPTVSRRHLSRRHDRTL